MVAWKYIHPVDENTVFDINVTTWKFWKIVYAMLQARMDFIISPKLILNIVLVIPKN